MAAARYLRRARGDLLAIARYTLETWGLEQANRYVDALEECCRRLAQEPTLGRVHAPLPRYWRIEHGSHVVFFRREKNGDVVIVRVLHKRMLPERHLNPAAPDDDEP